MYVWLNKSHSWHMLGCGSAGKLYFLSLLVNQLAPWIRCVFRVARWPVFHRPGRYFTAKLAEAVKGRYFENKCPKPVFWK